MIDGPILCAELLNGREGFVTADQFGIDVHRMRRNLHVQCRHADALALQLGPQCAIGLGYGFVPWQHVHTAQNSFTAAFNATASGRLAKP